MDNIKIERRDVSCTPDVKGVICDVLDKLEGTTFACCFLSADVYIPCIFVGDVLHSDLLRWQVLLNCTFSERLVIILCYLCSILPACHYLLDLRCYPATG